MIGTHPLNEVDLDISLDELRKLKLSLGDMTLGGENKSKVKPQLGPAFRLNTTLSSQRDARKETFVDDQSTKDRQDILLNQSLLSTSNVMVKLDLNLSLDNA